MTVDDIITQINGLKVRELVELKDRLQDLWGVTAAVPQAAIPVHLGIPDEVSEEQYEFDVVLVAFDPEQKIKTIQAVRAITSLGLKEAKESVDELPRVIGEAVDRDRANDMRATLEAVGATVEVR